MDTAKQRNIETFTRMAESYGGYYSDAEQARLGAMAERIGFGAGSWLVDFGMGTGTSARPFLVAGGKRRGAGSHARDGQSGRERLREWGVDANARYVMANAHDAPVAAGMADGAICRHTFHHLENPGQVFGEMARAVRPGGHVFLIDYHYPDEMDEREKLKNSTGCGNRPSRGIYPERRWKIFFGKRESVSRRPSSTGRIRPLMNG